MVVSLLFSVLASIAEPPATLPRQHVRDATTYSRLLKFSAIFRTVDNRDQGWHYFQFHQFRIQMLINLFYISRMESSFQRPGSTIQSTKSLMAVSVVTKSTISTTIASINPCSPTKQPLLMITTIRVC